MKQKVLSLLKPLLASKGFNKEELEGLAAIAATNLNDASTEEEINNAIGGIIPYADMMQKVANRMVSSVEAKYKGWVDPSKVAPQEPPKPVEPTSQSISMEDIQKLIAERVTEGIESGLRPYREQEEKKRLQGILYSHEKVKSVPDAFRSKYVLDKEDNLDAIASQIESDFAAVKQALVTSGEFAAPPQQGGTMGETDDLIQFLHDMGNRGAKV